MNNKEIKVRIINKSGRDLNKELAQYIAELYLNGSLKLESGQPIVLGR
ncbi:hypothetical protein ACXAT6_003362 [Clostridium sporogenes]